MVWWKWVDFEVKHLTLYLLAVCLLTSHSTSLGLGFYFTKVEKKIILNL